MIISDKEIDEGIAVMEEEERWVKTKFSTFELSKTN